LTRSRRILGIDPGLNRTGYGIVEIKAGSLRCVESGVIHVPAGNLPERLHAILRELAVIIGRGIPDEASVEKVFVNVNPQSTLLLGQARGAAICAAVSAGLAVYEYTALQVKQTTVGYGRADKVQIQKMVQRLLGLERAPPSDAADALACAICHAHASGREHGLTAQLAAVTGADHSARARAHGIRSSRRSRNAWRAFAGAK